MIKSILQVISSYVMSIFLLPKTLIDAFEKIMNAFWWAHVGATNKGIHWMSWEKLFHYFLVVCGSRTSPLSLLRCSVNKFENFSLMCVALGHSV
jgi:hypothetical protein